MALVVFLRASNAGGRNVFRPSVLVRELARMAGAPRKKPRLPVESPDGRQWSVRLESVEGRFATGMWRPPQRGFVFPSNVVEDAFGVRATARWWETFVKVARVIDESPSPA